MATIAAGRDERDIASPPPPPVEWLWRWLTYGERPPFRRRAAPPIAAPVAA